MMPREDSQWYRKGSKEWVNQQAPSFEKQERWKGTCKYASHWGNTTAFQALLTFTSLILCNKQPLLFIIHRHTHTHRDSSFYKFPQMGEFWAPCNYYVFDSWWSDWLHFVYCELLQKIPKARHRDVSLFDWHIVWQLQQATGRGQCGGWGEGWRSTLNCTFNGFRMSLKEEDSKSELTGLLPIYSSGLLCASQSKSKFSRKPCYYGIPKWTGVQIHPLPRMPKWSSLLSQSLSWREWSPVEGGWHTL